MTERVSTRRALTRVAVRQSLTIALVTGAVGVGWLLARAGAGAALRIGAWSMVGGVLTAALVAANARLFDRGAVPSATGPPRIGLANSLTIVRFALTAPLVCLMGEGRYADALAVYAALALTDVADGVVARARRETTVFGVVMDPVADIVSTYAVFTVFLVDNLIPLWLYLLLTVRYAMLGLGSLVLSRVAGPIEIRATIPGKVVGVVQAAGVVVIMVSAAGGPVDTGASGPLFAFLGLGFASIVVSQAVIGYRYVRRGAPDG